MKVQIDSRKHKGGHWIDRQHMGRVKTTPKLHNKMSREMLLESSKSDWEKWSLETSIWQLWTATTQGKFHSCELLLMQVFSLADEILAVISLTSLMWDWAWSFRVEILIINQTNREFLEDLYFGSDKSYLLTSWCENSSTWPHNNVLHLNHGHIPALGIMHDTEFRYTVWTSWFLPERFWQKRRI